MKRQMVFLLGLMLIALGCRKKSSDSINHGSIIFHLSHEIDGVKLLFDTVAYTNAAQNRYGVEKLEYYLSDFKIFKNGQLCYSGTDVVLVDARTDSFFSITPTNGLKAGVYDSVSFYIGVDPVMNVSNGLPATLGNLDMAWPDAMGGGYHFLKLEGHYVNNSLLAGYAMHLGQNGFQVSAGSHCSLNVGSAGNTDLFMVMNVNEWFRDPAVYDFNTDGVFSMGDTVLMKKLAANGADVFTTR